MPTSSAIERLVTRKVYARLLPFGILAYFLCYLDRVNISVAQLTMGKDLGLDAAAYALGLSAFYVGYVACEIPSNLILEKVGARVWIARIMITWGLASAATALCVGPKSLAIVRFLLGVFEAGFFPGLVLYFTYWFPDRQRARIVSGFMIALPMSVVVGSPLSTAILVHLDGLWGVAGWRWIFILEGLPTVLMGIGVFFYLTDRPAEAAWLDDEERRWLIQVIDAERRQVEARRKIPTLESLWNPKILLLALNFLGIVTASLGLVFFLPQIVKRLDLSVMETGWVTALIYLFATLSMVGWGWLSDRTGERRWNLVIACAVATVGLAISGFTFGTFWSIIGLSIAAIGLYGSKGAFFAMPPMLLTGSAAAVGFAWINSIGNLGGIFGPNLVGWVNRSTGSFAGGLYFLAGAALISTIVGALWLHIPRPAPVRAEAAAPAE